MKTKLTSSPEASHVNPTLWQESDWEKTTIDTYGLKCLEQFEKLNRGGLWARTFSELLIGTGDWYSTRCKLIWKVKGTKYNRIYFQLFPLAHRTEETEFGLLPTPMAQSRQTTEEQTMKRKEKYGGMKRAMYLENYLVMGMLPTPKNIENPTGETFQLSPQFVAEMMGFPKDWTELPFLNGEQNQSKVTETP